MGSHREASSLANADAHGAQRSPCLTLLELQRRREHQASSRHAKRVAERDGAAVRIEVLCIIQNAELADYGQRLT